MLMMSMNSPVFAANYMFCAVI